MQIQYACEVWTEPARMKKYVYRCKNELDLPVLQYNCVFAVKTFEVWKFFTSLLCFSILIK